MAGNPDNFNKCFRGLYLGLACVGIALSVWLSGNLEKFEAQTWDWRVSKLAKPEKASQDILVILLDQNSLNWAKEEMGLSWPWPREIYGILVDFCERNQARALAFDVIFTEPSQYGVADDLSFGKAVSKFKKTVFPIYLSHTSGSVTQWPKTLPEPPLIIKGIDYWLKEKNPKSIIFPMATTPVLDIAENASILCNVDIAPGLYGVYRKLPFFSLFSNKTLPVLGFGLFLTANPKTNVSIDNSGIKINDYRIPMDSQGFSTLRYRGPSGTYKTYSAASVLQSEIRFRQGMEPSIKDKNAFKNKYIFFGFSAPGLSDNHPAPVDSKFPGVEMHATLLDNLLSKDFIKPVPKWVTGILLTILTLSCGILLFVFSKPSQEVVISLMILPMPVLLSVYAYTKGYWLPIAVEELALILIVTSALIINYATEGKQKRFISRAFKQYLSPEVIDQIIQHPERLKLGGERRVLSIFFSDLEGFTSISENLEPEVLTGFLNQYLSAMSEIINQEGGTIDKYEGDAIIAFWNAPLEIKDHALRCVRASLRCQEKLAQMRPEFKRMVKKDVLMRIGINTSAAIVGNMGSKKRFDYTMIGDAVNLAARLEGANKQFDTYTMISESTRDELGDEFAMRELGRISVKGRQEPVRIFEPMFHTKNEEEKKIYDIFNKGLQSFYKGDFKRAVNYLTPIEKKDPAASAYIKKCRLTDNVAPEDWQGVWIMTQK